MHTLEPAANKQFPEGATSAPKVSVGPIRANHKLALLELLRFLAAIWVVLHHSAQIFVLHGGLWGVVSRTGRLPVMLFFLLSGFVIALRHLNRQETFAAYIRPRAARIYPVFIVALVITAAFPLGKADTLGVFVANLLMLQGPTFAHISGCFDPFGLNGPLWSLSIEWWFYVAFWWLKTKLPFVASRLVMAAGFVACVACMRFPFFVLVWVALFSSWWSGAELAREYESSGSLTFRKQLLPLITLGGMSLCLFAYNRASHQPIITYPRTTPTSFLFESSIYSLMFLAVAITCTKWISMSFGKAERIIGVLGGLSYALYATHYVVLEVAHKWNLPLSLTLGFSVTLAYAIESWIQPIGSRLIKRLGNIPPIPARQPA